MSTTFEGKYQQFVHQMFDRCAKESEDAAEKVMGIITFLLEDSQRIGSISQDVIQQFQLFSSEFLNQNGGLEGLKKKEVRYTFVSTLFDLSQNHKELQELITPIIESLQFQDRIRQNMENLEKCLKLWQALDVSGESENNYQDFANNLIQSTTMPDEREIIIRFFPEAEVPETSNDDVMFF